MSRDYQYDSSKNSPDASSTKKFERLQEIKYLTRESILVVRRNYPPLIGGMERLLKHTVEALAEHIDVTLISPIGSSKTCLSAIRVIECPASPFSFLLSAFFKGLPSCVGSKYRLILGGSGLLGPVTAALGKICGAKTAIFAHGLDLVVNNLIYQTFFIPLIRRHDVVIVNSGNTRKIALAKGCDATRVQILQPGSYIPDEDLLQEAESIKGKLEIGSRKLLLFVGRMIKRKGLSPFLRCAWPRVIEAMPDAKLLVAVEAAACGTPTVAFSAGGMVDAVADGVNGCLVQEGDYAAFDDADIATIQGNSTTRSQCMARASDFSGEKHQRKLISIIEDTAQPRPAS